MGESHGLDNISSEIIQHAEDAGIEELHHLRCAILEKCDWPKDWWTEESVIMVIQKNATIIEP